MTWVLKHESFLELATQRSGVDESLDLFVQCEIPVLDEFLIGSFAPRLI